MARPLVAAEPPQKLLDTSPSGEQARGVRDDYADFRTSHIQWGTTDGCLMDDFVDDLDTSTGPRLLGNLPRQLFVEHSRDLTEADLAALNAPRGSRPKSLVRIHASHHSLAKCLASGMKASHAALVTGYTANRISILQNDPAFQALVEDYRAEAKNVFADLAERMNDMSLDAIDLLKERLHDNPETFSIPVLLDVVKAFADRTGHGPGQEVHLKMDQNFIDRPPRESFDEWKERRARELGEGNGDSLVPTTRTTN